MRPRRPLRAALVASLLLVTASAQGAPRVTYDAPEGCPSAEEFVVMLRGRSVELRETDPALSLTVRPREEGFTGTLRVGEAPEAGPREVSGAKCVEVIDAMAAVAALALRSLPEEASPERPASPPQLVSTRLVDVSLSAGAVSGFLPGQPLGRVELSAERLELFGVSGTSRMEGAPPVRITLSLLGGGSYRWGTNTTEVGAQILSFGLCPYLFHDPRAWSLSVCAHVSAGLVGVSTTSDDGRKVRESQGWGGLGTGLRLRYGISARVYLGAVLGADLRTGPLVAESPAGERRALDRLGSFHGNLGVGVRFG